MPVIDSMLNELNEITVAQKVAIKHDEAVANYSLKSNRVGDFEEFTEVLTHYYIYHDARCLSHGGSLSPAEAAGRAKEIIEQEYRRRTNGSIVTAFNDAYDGTNGGMRHIIDIIADKLREESVERYIRDVFDRYVAPNKWEEKVEIIRQLLSQCGHYLSSSIRVDQPERYAQNYEELIRSYVAALEQTSSTWRRL